MSGAINPRLSAARQLPPPVPNNEHDAKDQPQRREKKAPAECARREAKLDFIVPLAAHLYS
jgi:hypothetical protein